jgi:hypothetical protein
MLQRIAQVLGGLVVIVVAIGVVFMVGMRSKSPAVLSAVRRTNRAVFNPRQMRSAGTPGAYASIIRHVGRRSGTGYETPIGVKVIDGGFLFTLPYGSQSDWVKNVLASGSATLVHEGETHLVDQPEIVSTDDVLSTFPPNELRTLRLFNVAECMTVRWVRSLDTQSTPVVSGH